MATLKTYFSNRLDKDMSLKTGESIQVIDNRLAVATRYSFNAFERRGLKIIPHGFSPKMVHGTDILVIRENDRPKYDGVGIMKMGHIECDSVITDCEGFPLIIPNADCYQIVPFDASKNVFSAIHSGRAGTLENIVGSVIGRMWEEFGSLPKNIIAHVFPGICSHCYFLEETNFNIPAYLKRFASKTDRGFLSLDLSRIIIHQLLKAGVRHVRFPEGKFECTCHTESIYHEPRYFSHYGYSHRFRFPKHKEMGNNALFVEMIP